ncbi:maleylpyruvate isomerase N-terminal domain-containing protein [Nonomuraea sp. NPDC050691]|uniref:maleylpyruvate isomerase N-terminal domain-containing protein n=1 Tax=Nonomuraea sp. NPDC050691 TaxID=3155661 RepID=UPI0033FA2FEE
MRLEFPGLLRLIEERSTAFRAAVASAPSLDVQVPTCPEWTLFDLAQHIGEGRRDWAATVAAGPAPAKSAAEGAPAVPREREALPAWLAESAERRRPPVPWLGTSSSRWRCTRTTPRSP